LCYGSIEGRRHHFIKSIIFILMQQRTYIVYQCYGDISIFHECALSLLSFSKWYSTEELQAFEFWIYTDKPEWFQAMKGCPLPLNYRKMDAATIQQWRGATQFVHRVKIELLLDFVQGRSGNVVYIDTDTVLLQRLDKVLHDISVGELFMHVLEGKISDELNPILLKLSRYLKGQQLIEQADGSLQHTMMWNAGMLGFQTQHSHLLQEVLRVTDTIHPHFSKHVVEQFAFSLVFQRTSNIHAAAPYFIHYWNFHEAKPIFASFFDCFKDADWADLLRYTDLIHIPVLLQEKIAYLHSRSIYNKLKRIPWQPVIPDWKEIIPQL
jgi:hypothetical protein